MPTARWRAVLASSRGRRRRVASARRRSAASTHGRSSVGVELLVLGWAAGAGERLGIQRGAGSCHSPVMSGSSRRPVRCRTPRPDTTRLRVRHAWAALVSIRYWAISANTAAHCSASDSSLRPPSASQSTWRARAAAALACFSAVQTVSDIPLVSSSRAAESTRSSFEVEQSLRCTTPPNAQGRYGRGVPRAARTRPEWDVSHSPAHR